MVSQTKAKSLPVNSLSFEAAVSKASLHSVWRETFPTRAAGAPKRSEPFKNSPIANLPSTQTGTFSFIACAATSFPSAAPSPRAHAASQNMHVDCVTASGLPYHLAYLSANAPVGQTSTHEPQN